MSDNASTARVLTNGKLPVLGSNASKAVLGSNGIEASSLRIGIDGRVLGVRPKGMARYIWELCKALDVVLPCAQFFIYSREETGLTPISSRWHLCVDADWARRLPKTLWAVTRPGYLARRDAVDIYWGGAGLVPLVGLSARSVLTVHDLVWKIMPHVMSHRARLATRVLFESSVQRADTVVTVSRGTASRLRELSGPKAAAVVPPALSPLFKPEPETGIGRVLARHGLRRPYILAVSTLEPRKGLDCLVRAISLLRRSGELSAHTLVIAGDRGWRDSSLTKMITRSDSRVAWLGFVDDSDLVALYSGCDVFVYPSRYEGFGMPVLEARGCGARVVASDLPEIREAGGADAIYVPPNESGIAQGILVALQSPPCPNQFGKDHTWLDSALILARVMLRLSSYKLAEN